MDKETSKSGKGRKAGSGVGIERERRKKMKDMFTSLHALRPQLPAKADHCTIVDEAVRYIRSLEDTLQTAQKQKQAKFRSSASSSISLKAESRTDLGCTKEVVLDTQEEEEPRPSNKLDFANTPSSTSLDFNTWFPPNVVLNICGNEAHISVCSPRREGLLSTVFYILEKHKLDVVSARISSDQHRCMYMIHPHYAKAYSIYSVPTYVVLIHNDQASRACDDTVPAGALSLISRRHIRSCRLAASELTLCLSYHYSILQACSK